MDARYAELEAEADSRRSARMRRQPLVLIGLVGSLVLAIGIVSSIDLRRLHTPRGVALRWAQAAVFGDCDDYLTFSTGLSERPRIDVCRELRAMTEDAREHNIEIGLTVRQVTTRGSTAVVILDITRKEEVRHATIDERRSHGRWLVVRDATTCAVVACA